MFGIIFNFFGIKRANKSVQTKRVRLMDNIAQTATRMEKVDKVDKATSTHDLKEFNSDGSRKRKYTDQKKKPQKRSKF